MDLKFINNFKILYLPLFLSLTIAQAAPVATGKLMTLGAEAEKAGNNKNAEKLYRKAADSSKSGTESEVATLALSRIMVKQGRLEDATEVLQEYLDEKNNFSVDVIIALSDVQRKTGRYEEAIRSAQSARKLRPNHSQANEKEGLALFDQGKFDEASRFLGEFIKTNPSALEAKLRRAQAFLATGKQIQAVEDLELLAKSHPADLEVRKTLSEAYTANNQLQEAEASYQIATTINTGQPELFEKLGDIQFQRRRFEPAIQSFTRAVQLEPARFSSGERLARAFVITKQFALAEKEYRRHLEIDPAYEQSIQRLGELFASTGARDKLAAFVKEKAEENPSLKWASLQYAKSLYYVNRYDVARKVMKRHESMAGESTESRLFMAAVEWKLGNNDDASEIITEVEKTSPKNELVKFNRAIIAAKDPASKDKALAMLRGFDPSNPMYDRAQAVAGSLSGTGSRMPASVQGENKTDRRDRFMRQEKIREGDTLQKISMRLYGTTTYWSVLFSLNRKALKESDTLAENSIIKVLTRDEMLARSHEWLAMDLDVESLPPPVSYASIEMELP